MIYKKGQAFLRSYKLAPPPTPSIYPFSYKLSLFLSLSQSRRRLSLLQSTGRVAMAAFWRTFNHDEKIRPGWLGWGRGGRCTPTLFHYSYHHVQSCSVRSS